MKHNRTLNPTVFSFTLLAFTFLACDQARALPATAKLVPAETILLADVDNFSKLKQQFEKTNIYKLYKDPAMAGFVDDVRAKWREKIKELDNEIAGAVIDAGLLPQGRVAVALVLDKQSINTKKPPALLITQWGENIAKIREAVDKMTRKAVEDGAHRKTEDCQGVTIVTMVKERSTTQVPHRSDYNSEHNDVPTKAVQPLPVKTHYCFIDDCLIGSMNLDVLKFVIAHIKGATGPTLADDADYTGTIKAIGPYHDIDLYINIKQIIKAMAAEDTTGKAQTTIANLGFDNVTSAGCSIGLARGQGSSSRGKALVKIDGAKKGIPKMFEFQSAVLRAPPFIPASTYSATFLNLNIKKAYSELANILNRFSPQLAAIMYMPLLPPSPEGEPGLQLKNDIIDHFGSQILLTQSIKKPFSNKASIPTESLVALEVNNRTAIEKSLSLLHSKLIAPNDPDARRELLGHTIYLISLPALLPAFTPGERTPLQTPPQPTTPPMPIFAFTVTDTHLIFGVESSVEQAIRTLSSTEVVSVGSAKWFTSAKLAIPSVVGLAGLEDNAASGELLWWMMRQGSKANASSASMGPNPGLVLSQMGFGLFDFSLLPDFNAVRKYFGLSAFYGISRPDGFFFEFKDINPTCTD